MSSKIKYQRIKIRRDSLSNWDLENPVLLDGELGYVKGTKELRVGNGLDHWSSLPSVGKVSWDNVEGRPSSLPASDVYEWAKAETKPSYTWSEIGSKPTSFSPEAHTHAKSEITDFPTSMPASDVSSWAKAATKPSYSWSEIGSKPTSFTPSAHPHSKSDITDFPAIPTTLPASDVYAWAKASEKPSYSWSEIGSKPTTFSPSAHPHLKADITDFPASLPASDVYAWAKAATKPSYAYSEITGTPASLPASDVYTWAKAATKPSYSWSEISDKPTSMPASDVYAWAKAASKPTYTNTEVGAAATAHDHWRITYVGVDSNVVSAAQTSSSYYGSSADWASYIICNHGNGANYYHQMLRLPFGGGLQSQVMVGGSLSGWRTYLDSTNWSSYAQKPISSGTGNPSGGSSGDIYIKYT